MAQSGLFAKRDTSSVTYGAVRPLIKWTYAWMFIGLLITTAIARFTNASTLVYEHPELFIGSLIAELVLVLGISFLFNRISPAVAGILFVVYAALNGLTISLVLLAYTDTSATLAFLSTAAIFGVMSIFAFTTSIDLLQFRTYFFVALIGLMIALVINIFVHSDAITTLISFAGVLIFTGLTAYDTQKIKYLAASPQFQEDGSLVAKYSIFMALQLYLDFVNLFLFMLRLLGRRR